MNKKRTKIVCTIGPACQDIKILEQMILAGMNVARLNFSHGNHKSHGKMIKNIRKIAKKIGEPVAIIQDLQGPRIRLGELPSAGIELKKGDKIWFDTSIKKYQKSIIPIDFSKLADFVAKGHRILINDGKIEVKVLLVQKNKIKAEVVYGGKIESHKGINVPDTKLDISVLSQKDKKDVKFGIEQGVDFMAMSFVTGVDDILDLKFLIKGYEVDLKKISEQPIKIIAKIERKEAVENIDEILEVVDAIMIARGDLGIEIPAQKVPLIQKDLIDRSLLLAKPVIVATQMLDSMQNSPRPTRAEVSDVSNAVIDHSDAVMLSNETASGLFPVESVAMMNSIILEAENSVYDDLETKIYNTKKKKIDDVITEMSKIISEEIDAKMILVASISGETARMISRHRPERKIAVSTNSDRTKRQLNLSWGVEPFVLQKCKSIEELVERSVLFLKKKKEIKKGDKIIIVAGEPVGQAGNVNLLEVRDIK